MENNDLIVLLIIKQPTHNDEKKHKNVRILYWDFL